jgi:hypothetical protein
MEVVVSSKHSLDGLNHAVVGSSGCITAVHLKSVSTLQIPTGQRQTGIRHWTQNLTIYLEMKKVVMCYGAPIGLVRTTMGTILENGIDVSSRQWFLGRTQDAVSGAQALL